MVTADVEGIEEVGCIHAVGVSQLALVVSHGACV